MKKLFLFILIVITLSGCKDDNPPPTPVIASFAPEQGAVGTSVTITGTNFSASASDNIVNFNNTSATVSSATTTELVVVVPANATSGKISVTVGEKTGVSTNNFSVLIPPVITSFNPQSGAGGAAVSIIGSNFSSTVSQNVVKFNGVPASINSSTTTSILVTVPETATTGKLSLEVNGFTTESATNFSITPTITSFSPSSGTSGTTVEITGKNFSTVISDNIVKFNGTLATVTEASSHLLKVTAPVDGITGKISVEISGVIVSSATNFIFPPTITGFSPAEGIYSTDGGIYSTLVGIAGTNFNVGAANNSLKFNGVTAEISSASAVQILVKVPNGASTGKISVTSNGFTATSAQDFIVSPWARMKGLSTGRYNSVGFVIGSKAYVIGGIGFNGGLADVWEYDPATNQWTQKASFPGTLRGNAAGFSVGNKGYYGTGGAAGTGDFLKDFWEFDPQANSWTQKADFPGTARMYAAGFGIDSYGYMGSGNTPTLKSDFYRYDPANNSWSPIADFGGGPRMNASGVVLLGKAYFGLGWGDSGSKSDIWEYNPSNNQWVRKADFPSNSRSHAVSFVINDKGYFGLGSSNDGAYKDLWIYNSVFNVWAQKKDFWDGTRTEAFGFGINGKGYVTCGMKGGGGLAQSDLWEYDPAKD